jgi:translocation and assembly module TamA
VGRGRRAGRALATFAAIAIVAASADERGRAQTPDEPDPTVGAAPEAEAGPSTEPAAEPSEGPTVPYEVVFTGDLPDELRTFLGEVSQAQKSTDQPPSSLARLRRRVSDDLPRLREALRSRGYYDSEIELKVESATQPARVTYAIEPGPLYTFGEPAIEVGGESEGLELPELEALGLAAGDPAAARLVLDVQERLLENVRRQGFVLAELERPKIIVDHDQRKMEVTYRLLPGPRGRFGETVVEGLTTVEQELVDRRLDWKDGELITPDKLEEARRRLVETGLFQSVRITAEKPQGDDAVVPVKVVVSERKHRSIGIGARYRTDEGPGGSIFWEHRNLGGRGENLSVTVDGSGIGYFLRGSFRKIDFLRLNQAFIADSEFRYDDTDAFESTSASASAGVEREFRPGLIGRGSLAFRYVKIQDVENGDEGPFGLLSLPLSLAWDTSDDLFDPSEGGRLYVDEEPFIDLLDPALTFNKLRVDYSHYIRLLDKPRLIFAARGAVGTAVGAERDDIPADERYYAGGGGSIRGFGFQKAGELDDDGDPIGGRSLLELAGEFRVNITETIGAVGFVDAGGAYESSFPNPSEDLFVGTGVGLRYFSPIGPVRFDVGFPLNARDEDDAFQIYISIGQAF